MAISELALATAPPEVVANKGRMEAFYQTTKRALHREDRRRERLRAEGHADLGSVFIRMDRMRPVVDVIALLEGSPKFFAQDIATGSDIEELREVVAALRVDLERLRCEVAK